MQGQPPLLAQDDVWTLFLLIDVDASGRVDIEEFVSGCMQLRGPAQSLQVAKMSRSVGEFGVLRRTEVVASKPGWGTYWEE
jgi:hypothetical protein